MRPSRLTFGVPDVRHDNTNDTTRGEGFKRQSLGLWNPEGYQFTQSRNDGASPAPVTEKDKVKIRLDEGLTRFDDINLS
jgi:hypothetical protein